jgi:hypothetical protein
MNHWCHVSTACAHRAYFVHLDCRVLEAHLGTEFGRVVWVAQFGGDVELEVR